MLTDAQVKEIKRLQLVCEQEEQITLKLNWDMLQAKMEIQSFVQFHYENDQLVGFIGFYNFGSKYEICGMVHPSFRRSGIFSRLLKKGLSSVSGDVHILLNTPANSESGKGFIKSIGGMYSFSENQMVYKGDGTFTFLVNHLTMRQATESDLELLTKMDMLGFQENEKDARAFNSVILQEENGETYRIIEVENECVGKIRIQQDGNETWIYSFTILPHYRGKSYGRETLMKVVKQEVERGRSVHLEVVIENDYAQKLYTGCGFVSYDTQDYYKFKKEA